MRIYVHVLPKSSLRKIEKIDENQYKAKVCSAPTHGKANRELIKLLSEHFGVSKSQITIVGGKTARDKIIDIDAKKA